MNNDEEIKKQLEDLQLLLKVYAIKWEALSSMNEEQKEEHINSILEEIERLKKLLSE
ncbi:MAG: hypothetical protein LBL90_01160 [Prevotellaceae bacterium]|jgi:hypothetical protein|nr:hypothetical protein [Prevotellaceae bacterium]